MTDGEFNELKAELERAIYYLRELQDLYHRETGKTFVPGGGRKERQNVARHPD